MRMLNLAALALLVTLATSAFIWSDAEEGTALPAQQAKASKDEALARSAALEAEAAMVEGWKRSIGKDDMTNQAHRALGNFYMGKENWTEALKWWEDWKPTGWCGTGVAGAKGERAYKIAICKTRTTWYPFHV